MIMLRIPNMDTYKVIENAQEDIFIKHPNGILEIYFWKTITFNYYGEFGGIRLYQATNVNIPADTPLKKGITIDAIPDASGTDVVIAGISNVFFMGLDKDFVVPSIYVFAPGVTNSQIGKIIHFHIIGKWK